MLCKLLFYKCIYLTHVNIKNFIHIFAVHLTENESRVTKMINFLTTIVTTSALTPAYNL